MYATDFEYNGTLLSSLGYMICSFDGSSNGNVSAGSDITFNMISPNRNSKFRIYSSKYESSYTTTFSICKNIESMSSVNQDEQYLSTNDISELHKWLCRKSFKKFKAHQDGYEDIFWNGVFTSEQYLINGRTAGLTLTLITDAPFAYQEPEKESTYDFYLAKDVPFEIYDTSDEEGFIHPNLTITVLEPGTFTLSNSMDNKIMRIYNCSENEVITIDGENLIISSTMQNHITSDFNYYYPKIVNDDGHFLNQITSSLDCKIELSYAPIRKIGL